MDEMEAAETRDHGIGGQSVTALLADHASRAVLVALGDAETEGVLDLAVTEQLLPGTTPRLIRDRLRSLERSALIASTGGLSPGAPAQWALTPAGRDLYRLLALIARIIAHASKLHAGASARTRERVVEKTLRGLSDPIVAQIVRGLASAGEPLGPLALQAACEPTPRRTLYRRLGELVDDGVVIRISHATVPRTSSYSLSPRWRPVAAVPLLAAWWEGRHWAPDRPLGVVDLDGIVRGVLPTVRADTRHDGRTLRWTLDQPGNDQVIEFEVRGDRLELAGPGGTPDAEITGGPAPWATALVTDRIDELAIEGDASLARATINAVRAALLAYVR